MEIFDLRTNEEFTHMRNHDCDNVTMNEEFTMYFGEMFLIIADYRWFITDNHRNHWFHSSNPKIRDFGSVFLYSQYPVHSYSNSTVPVPIGSSALWNSQWLAIQFRKFSQLFPTVPNGSQCQGSRFGTARSPRRVIRKWVRKIRWAVKFPPILR